MELASLDPTDPDFIQDPYPFYAALRQDSPVSLLPSGMLALARRDDIEAVLKDPRFGQDATGETMAGPVFEPSMVFLRHWMLFRDPPAHTRLRGAVIKAFTARRVADMRDQIRANVDALIDAVAPLGRMDIVTDFARPLPFRVICEMIGIPEEDRPMLRGIVNTTKRALDPLPLTRKQTRESNEAVAEMAALFARLFAERRREPRDDLISALVLAADREHDMTDDEIVANIGLLFSAGYETTMNLIGNGLLALHRNPAQLARLRADASLMPNAIEEMLRYEAPVQITRRVASESVELHGHQVERGEKIVLLLGSANRDARHYAEPDSFDVARPDIRHLAFGGGIHFCLGAQLGRLEASIAFSRLFERLPDLVLPETENLEWHPTFTLRGLVSLEARWRV